MNNRNTQNTGMRSNKVRKGGEAIGEGTLHGGEAIDKGTLHGGEAIGKGTLHGAKELQPGTLHSEETLKGGTLCTSYSPGIYRTRDGSAIYKFGYVERRDGSFDIDIIEQPSYGQQPDDYVSTHRLPSDRGGSRICFNVGKEPKDIEQAKQISVEWAELTHTYILTGQSLDSQIAEYS